MTSALHPRYFPNNLKLTSKNLRQIKAVLNALLILSILAIVTSIIQQSMNHRNNDTPLNGEQSSIQIEQDDLRDTVDDDAALISIHHNDIPTSPTTLRYNNHAPYQEPTLPPSLRPPKST